MSEMTTIGVDLMEKYGEYITDIIALLAIVGFLYIVKKLVNFYFDTKRKNH